MDGSHEAMHKMMDAMHGEDTADRMHDIDGVEEMMTQCSGMMDMMAGMDMSRMGEMMRDGGMMDGGMMDGGMMGMMGIWMLLIVLVFLALIGGGVYLLVRAVRGNGADGPGDAQGRMSSRSDALAILEERYARGEIDAEEFEERRRTLGG